VAEETVETYLQSKSIEYSYSGDQLKLSTCQACGSPDKFYINSENWLFSCKSSSCSWSGNERKFKAHFGDKVGGQAQRSTGQSTNSSLPDVEAAHQALLADDSVINFLNDERGISLDVVKKMRLGLGTKWFDEEQGEVKCLMYPYFVGKNCVFVKYRSLPPAEKGFRSTGGIENPLYNSNVIKNQMDSLCCVEGEIDCLSLLSVGVENVVGVPGADMKRVTWDKLLDRPRKLYLIYDNDQAGQDGAKKFAQRFGVDRFYNVVLPSLELAEPQGERTHSKDINEWLMAGGSVEELNRLLEEAQRFDVDDVSDSVGALDELQKEVEGRGGSVDPEFKFFLKSINDRAGGANRGDVTMVMAAAKAGKTTWAINQADFLAQQGHSVFFDCLEMKRTALVRKWAAMVTKTDDTPGTGNMTVEIMREAAEIAKGYSGKIQWGNPHSLKTLDDATNRIRDAVRRYGCDTVVFDNLQLLVDTTLTKFDMGNRVTYMSMVCKRFKQLMQELNTWGIMIVQPKRIMDSEMVGISDGEGSSAMEKDCDSQLILNRFQTAKLKRSDMERMGNQFTTEESFTPIVNVRAGLNRFAGGGVCNIYLEGAMSWFREINEEEVAKGQPAPLLPEGEGYGVATAI
jgi:KaiC/GvpD/RAD55 family RecA-like ATPase/5S rRNA maturation endonuclease (ribonuclease M5)